MAYTQLFVDLTRHIETLVTVGGYPLLFLLVALEGIPLVGTLVPGHIAIIVAGLLIKVGVFSLWPTIIISIIAAAIGDYIGYFLGKKYGLSLIDRLRPFFFITDKHITKAQDLLAKHTGKAMIFGRLSPMTRALMPFLVGTNKAEKSRFWIFNIIGGTIWVLLSILLGYVFGAGYQAATVFTGKFMLISIIATLIILWGYHFVNVRFHVFKRYELFVLILNIISLWVLAQVIRDTWLLSSPLIDFDFKINQLSAQYVTQSWAIAADWISALGSNAITVSLGVVVAVVLSFKKRWRSVIIMLVSLASTSVAVGFMKEFFMRFRPNDALQIWNDYSFPSAHAALAAAFFLVVAYITMPKIKSWILRELVFVGCVIMVIAIGLSRLVLNVHWASDVMAGWALGFFCATGSILAVRYIGMLFKRKTLG